MSSPNNMQEMRKNPNQHLMAVKLKNFKSIASQEIPLSPLSVFVGSNSSGKTTVIQSVLTRMRAKPYGKNTMSLNRDRSKLISFSRIKRENSSKEEKIGIGFKLKFDSIPSSRGIFGGRAINRAPLSKQQAHYEDIEVNQFLSCLSLMKCYQPWA